MAAPWSGSEEPAWAVSGHGLGAVWGVQRRKEGHGLPWAGGGRAQPACRSKAGGGGVPLLP